MYIASVCACGIAIISTSQSAAATCVSVIVFIANNTPIAITAHNAERATYYHCCSVRLPEVICTAMLYVTTARYIILLSFDIIDNNRTELLFTTILRIDIVLRRLTCVDCLFSLYIVAR